MKNNMENNRKKRVKLNKNEVYEKYNEQIQLLIKRCKDFDNGEIIETLSIATILRNLLHDNSNSRSKSLLKQIGRKERFLNSETEKIKSSTGKISRSLLTYSLLGNIKHNWQPIFDNPNAKLVSFVDWWNEYIILIDYEGNKFTRKDIIKTLVDQDGGAHQDTSIDSKFYNLTRNNSMKIKLGNGNKWNDVNSPVSYIVRQIAHEVLRSLESQDYKVNLENYKGLGMSVVGFH